MTLEAALLTGGASRRMGVDKASLSVEGVPLAERIGRELALTCAWVTVLGQVPLPPHRFLADTGDHEGPLVVLSRLDLEKDAVFVCSCDLPAFHHSVVEDLSAKIDGYEAAVPVREGRAQPLCALYRASAFEALRETVDAGERRIMAWLDRLRLIEVEAGDLRRPNAVANANTPEDLAQILGHS